MKHPPSGKNMLQIKTERHQAKRKERNAMELENWKQYLPGQTQDGWHICRSHRMGLRVQKGEQEPLLDWHMETERESGLVRFLLAAGMTIGALWLFCRLWRALVQCRARRMERRRWKQKRRMQKRKAK